MLGVVTLFSMGDIIVTQLQEDIQQDKLAMVKVGLTTSESEAELLSNADFLQLVDAQPGVSLVDGQISSQFLLQGTRFGGLRPGVDGGFLRADGCPALGAVPTD